MIPKWCKKSVNEGTMKQYLMNLMMAITGKDPFRAELEKVRSEYEKTARNFESLNEMYLKGLERLDESSKKLKAAKAETMSQQRLVDNLRARVTEKDALIAEMEKDYGRQADGYKRRIADYGEQVARLQGELAKVRKRGKTVKAAAPKAKKQEKKA